MDRTIDRSMDPGMERGTSCAGRIIYTYILNPPLSRTSAAWQGQIEERRPGGEEVHGIGEESAPFGLWAGGTR